MANDEGRDEAEHEPRSRTEAMLAELRRMPVFRALIPMESGVGWPIPVRRAGDVYARIPLYPIARDPDRGGHVLFPPRATVTLTWSNLRPVEYVDLLFSRPWEPVDPPAPVGQFPHAAVAGTVGEYREDRVRLLGMYDALFQALGGGAPLPDEWAAGFSALLRKLVEPGLEPYYRLLGPGFFDRFLPGAAETSAGTADREAG